MGPGTETSTVKVGDRVGIKWISAICGNCPACLSGHDGVCFNQKVSGYYTPGTFQQYVCGPANYVTPIPDSLPSDAAAPMLCKLSFPFLSFPSILPRGEEGPDHIADEQCYHQAPA